MAYNKTYTFKFISTAGIKYVLEFYDQIAGVDYYNKVGVLGKNACSVDFGSEDAKMYSPLKPSTLNIEFMVSRFRDARYITELRSRSERDVYVYLYVAGSNYALKPDNDPIFAGYLLNDLSDDPDVAMPYAVNLTAVDGLASLKYYDFIPEEINQSPDHLYVKSDTWIPDPNNPAGQYASMYTFIRWIGRVMHYTGYATTTKGANANAKIQTSVNWYNSAMASASGDPLALSKIDSGQFYQKEGDTGSIKYRAMSCYDALKSICKTWGMRCFVWKNTFYFIQVHLFANNNSGTLAAPTNIPYFRYNISGTTNTSSGTALDLDWSRYYLPVALNQPNKKLSGSQYGILPAFKKVTVDFFTVSNSNYFAKFPELTSPWPTTVGTPYYEVAYETIGIFEFDGSTDQTFYQEIWVQFTNNNSVPVNFHTNWTVEAKKVGTSTYYRADLVNYASSGVVEWVTNVGSPVTACLFGDAYYEIPVGISSVDFALGGMGTGNWWPCQWLPCPASRFTAGEWEFRYKTVSKWDVDAQHLTNGHGISYPMPSTGATNPPNDPDSNLITYVNSSITSGAGSSMFSPLLSGAIGSSSTNTQIFQVGDDTYFEDVNQIFWGDVESQYAPSRIKVYTGSTWVQTELTGAWGADSVIGSDTLSELLAQSIIARQAQNVRKFNTKIIMDLDYWKDDSSGTFAAFPAPFTRFFTPSHGPTNTASANWIIHTGNFNPKLDQWNLDLYEFKTFEVESTTSTTTTTGSNTGQVGTGTGTGLPDPDKPSAQAKFGYITHSIESKVNKLHSSRTNPIAIINEDQYLSDLSSTQSITTLDVQKMPEAILKSGDTIVIQAKQKPEDTTDAIEFGNITFTVNADQSADDTTISVTEKAISQSIFIGDIITIYQPDLMAQYQNKTKGSVAGFAVDDNAFTKDGIEIRGFTDSDTMEGSDLNLKLPTTESVKAYADTKQTALSLTTEGTSGASTLVGSTLNIPQYSGGGTENYRAAKIGSTSTTSATAGAGARVVAINFDTELTASTSTDITLYGSSGVTGIADSAYAFGMGNGKYDISYTVTTNTDVQNNRILTGIKLQFGVDDAGTMTWADLEPTTTFIYDRGNGDIRQGSTSARIFYNKTVTAEYYRVVFWKESSTSANTVSISVSAGCCLTVKQL